MPCGIFRRIALIDNKYNHMRTGVRVVRGPQWKWGDQDGGEGYVGTVVELPAIAPKTCIVQWDCKPMMNYRAGLSSRYDLRVFDSAPSGIKHDRACSGCNDRVICGILWSCAECENVHLCTFCYMNDKHFVSHKFRRVYDQGSVAVLLPPRRLCQKIDSYGVFQSASVRRGRDWNWDNQDGDGTGVVTSLQGWSEESSRSVVCVQWQNGASNVYRMGHRGKTDLIAIRPAKGWSYYVEHLPNFGEEIAESRLPIFTIGETVKVDANVTRVKKLSDGHGQWHDNMKHYVGDTGTVHRITENDDVRIIFNDRQKWTYNPKAITKIFRLNDKVMLTSDCETLREYHGDAFKQLERLRGVHGVVKDTRPETCLYVVGFQNGAAEYVHGNCLYAVDTADRLFNTLAEEQLAAAAAAGVSGVQRTLPQPQQQAPPPMEVAFNERIALSADNIAEFFAALDQGRVDKVRDMLTNFPDLANADLNDRKALIAAVHSGKPELLRLLAQCGADVSVKDQMGDSIIHIAIKKRFLHLLPVFVEPAFQSVINCTNRIYDTALHTSIKMGYIEAVKCLLQIPGVSGALKDREGNMPLHAAIDSDKDDIVEVLLSHPRLASPTLVNEDGHNALHLACIKGKTRFISKILLVSPELINVSNKRGFAPLHLAVFHNQVDALRLILEQKFIHVNGRIMRNRDFNSFTALHLAVAKMLPRCVEILIDDGKAELSLTEDVNQMTPFHVAVESLIKVGCNLSPQDLFNLQQIPSHMAKMDELVERCMGCLPLAICCFLIVRGADLNVKNKQMATPYDILNSDPSCKTLVPTFNSFSVMAMQSRGNSRNITGVPLDPRMQLQSNSASSSGVSSTSFARRSPVGSTSSSSAPLSTMSDVKTNDVDGDICRACNESVANVRYEPCNHILFCVKCISQQSHKMCSRCDMPIKTRIGPAGEVKTMAKSQNSPIDMQCPICMERLKNIAPDCGHTLCSVCARNLSECPFCRGPMSGLRPVFL